jgi:hypothetical protein
VGGTENIDLGTSILLPDFFPCDIMFPKFKIALKISHFESVQGIHEKTCESLERTVSEIVCNDVTR